MNALERTFFEDRNIASDEVEESRMESNVLSISTGDKSLSTF